MIGSADSARQSAPGGPGPGPGPAGGPPPAPKAKSKGKGPHNTGSRVALRNWRISTRLVSLLALPVVAATSLGALRINQSMDDIQQLDNMKLLTDLTKQATQLAAALQDERDSSAGPLAHGGKASDFDVKGPRDKTDRARQAFLEGTKPIDDVGGREGLEGINSSVRQIASQLRGLSDARAAAYTDRNSSSQTVDAYSMLIEELLALSQDMAQATSNPEMVQRTRALAAFSSAKEYASVQRAVIAAALPANNKDKGSLSELDRRYAANAFSKEDAELTGFKTIYEGDAKELLKPIDDGNSNIKESMAYADRVLESPGAMENSKKRSYKDWLDASTTKINAMTNIERTLLGEMEDKARELRDESEQGAIISGAVILLVLGVSLVGAFIVARSMIRSLRRLQDTATKVAQDRLPELVKQLSESDPQDVDTSVESVGVHSRDEIGQVARPSTTCTARRSGWPPSRPCCGATSTRCSPTCRAVPRASSSVSSRSSPSWSPARPTPTSCRRCSSSTTSRPVCAVTARTSWSSPVRSPAAAGPGRCRWSTCCVPPRPRWSSTSGSSCPRCPAPRSPAGSSTTSSTCSPSCWRTPRRSPPRRPRSRSPGTRCPTAGC